MTDLPRSAPVTTRPQVRPSNVSATAPKTVGATSTPDKGNGNLGYRRTITPVGANKGAANLAQSNGSKGLARNS